MSTMANESCYFHPKKTADPNRVPHTCTENRTYGIMDVFDVIMGRVSGERREDDAVMQM